MKHWRFTLSFVTGELVVVEKASGSYADRVVAAIGNLVELEYGGTLSPSEIAPYTDPAAEERVVATLRRRREADVEQAIHSYTAEPNDENRERMAFLSRNLLRAESSTPVAL